MADPIRDKESRIAVRLVDDSSTSKAIQGDWREASSILRHSPWGPEDLLRWFMLWVVGTAMLIGGWYLAAGTSTFRGQIGPTNIAIVGAIIVSMANVLWVLRGRRVVGERLRSILAPASDLIAAFDGEIAEASESAGLVAGGGRKHFHRSTCPMATGRDWPSFVGNQPGGSNQIPCSVCRPVAM